MKRTVLRTLAVILAVVTVLSACSAGVSAEEWNKTELRTSYNPTDGIVFTITGSKLDFEGVIGYVPNLESVGILCLDMMQKNRIISFSDVKEGEKFSGSLSLESFSDTIQIISVVKTTEMNEYVLYFGPIGYINKYGADYVFEKPSNYDKNLAFDSAWRNPADYLPVTDEELYDLAVSFFSGNEETGLRTLTSYMGRYLTEQTADMYLDKISHDKNGVINEKGMDLIDELVGYINATRKDVKTLSDKIVGDETDEYEKVRLLNYWVSDNLYYDMRFSTSGKGATNDMAGVMKNKVTVCRGYADLLTELIKEQGIPAYGVYCGNPLEGNRMNHIFVEAFVDGRWVMIDPTWNSLNYYQNGRTYKQVTLPAFFDLTKAAQSPTHSKLDHADGYPDAEDVPSDWALNEVGAAFGYELVPYSLQGNYRDKITREEFCTLVTETACRYLGCDSLDGLIETCEADTDAVGFTDTENEAVLAASALGIVNGVGDGLFDPDGFLTREQAATMLTRAAKVLGIESAGECQLFCDRDEIAKWAADGVEFVSRLVSADGSAVMGGTGESRFSPKGSYTREQSILTVYRLFRCK